MDRSSRAGRPLTQWCFDLLEQTATEENIPYTLSAAPKFTGTDADAIHSAHHGIPTGLISVPNRYMHSPNEMVTLSDLDATANLLAGFNPPGHPRNGLHPTLMAILNPEPIAKKLHAAFCRDESRTELLHIAAREIRAAGGPYTSVYMYMLDETGKTLALEAFDGRETEHTSIPIGRGLCGKAVTEARNLNIADVNAETEYLACNIYTKSELIVLIRRHDDILGQIDIDSDVVDGFDQDEEGRRPWCGRRTRRPSVSAKHSGRGYSPTRRGFVYPRGRRGAAGCGAPRRTGSASRLLVTAVRRARYWAHIVLLRSAGRRSVTGRSRHADRLSRTRGGPGCAGNPF